MQHIVEELAPSTKPRNPNRSHSNRRQRVRQSIQAAVQKIHILQAVIHALEPSAAFVADPEVEHDVASIQTEVADRLAMIAPGIWQQVAAAFIHGQEHHFARQLLPRDDNQMATAAKHQFHKPILEIDPHESRQVQRGNRKRDDTFTTSEILHIMFSKAGGLDNLPMPSHGICCQDLEQHNLEAVKFEDPCSAFAGSFTPFSGTAWNLQAEPYEPFGSFLDLPMQDGFMYDVVGNSCTVDGSSLAAANILLSELAPPYGGYDGHCLNCEMWQPLPVPAFESDMTDKMENPTVAVHSTQYYDLDQSASLCSSEQSSALELDHDILNQYGGDEEGLTATASLSLPHDDNAEKCFTARIEQWISASACRWNINFRLKAMCTICYLLALIFYIVSGRGYEVALCVGVCTAVYVIVLKYRAYNFLCAALAWGHDSLVHQRLAGRLLMRNLEQWKITPTAVQCMYSFAVWAMLYQIMQGPHAVLVFFVTSFAACMSCLYCIFTAVVKLFTFLCGAIAWGKAWYAYHYPARIQHFRLKGVVLGIGPHILGRLHVPLLQAATFSGFRHGAPLWARTCLAPQATQRPACSPRSACCAHRTRRPGKASRWRNGEGCSW